MVAPLNLTSNLIYLYVAIVVYVLACFLAYPPMMLVWALLASAKYIKVNTVQLQHEKYNFY